ncbi:MAG: hypothetical protein AAGE59_13790 [Cyanobacteria bacterium P01_F01_bin.86]
MVTTNHHCNACQGSEFFMHLKSFILLGLISALAVGCSNDGKAGTSNIEPGLKTYHVPPVDPNTSSAGTVSGEATTGIPSTQPSPSSNETPALSTFGNTSDNSLDTSPETLLPSTRSTAPDSADTNPLSTGLPSPGVIGSDPVNADDLSTRDTFNNIYPSNIDTDNSLGTGSLGNESNVTGNAPYEMPLYKPTTEADYLNNNLIDGNP